MAEFRAFLALDYRRIDLYKGYEDAAFAKDQTDPAHRFYVYTSPTTAVTVEGSGFQYGPNSIPVAGTTKTAALYVLDSNGNYQPGYTLSKVSITIQDAADYIQDKPKAVAEDIFKGNDQIFGSKFADHLNGYKGKNELTGGDGADTFYFTYKEKTNMADAITDFDRRLDRIALENSAFRGISKANLDDTFHDITNDAKERNDRILYNHDTGVLSYDPDGSGRQKAVTIAIVSVDVPTNNPKLNLDDFVIV